eukprot:COSAG06_NODE_16622_length_990_cov_1.123457_1_plen_225_part_01
MAEHADTAGALGDSKQPAERAVLPLRELATHRGSSRQLQLELQQEEGTQDAKGRAQDPCLASDAAGDPGGVSGRQARRKRAAEGRTKPSGQPPLRRDRDPDRQLRHAAWKGDLDLARRSVGRGGNVEAQDSDGFTPVLIAARWGRLEMVKYLAAELNADLTARNRFGDTAFTISKLYGHAEVMEHLGSLGCSSGDANQLDVDTDTANATSEWVRRSIAGMTPSSE